MKHRVQVEVQEIRRNGVVVQIPGDRRVGFIRRRELSWDRRIGFIPQMPSVGEQIYAAVIRDRKGAHYVYLSPRQLSDPWQVAKERYHLNQVVRGEVVNVRSFGVFVQIDPGIDAIIWPKDIPLLRGQLLEDVLSVGDQVQGIIASIDVGKRQIEISLTKRLQQLSISPAERKPVQRELFRDKLSLDGITDIPHHDPNISDVSKAARLRYHPPISRPERLLVIDDDENDLREICRYLEEVLKIQVDGVRSSREALKKVRMGMPYGLVVIDVILENEHGAKVAEELLNQKPGLVVVFTSANPLIEEELATMNTQRFSFAAKYPEDIAECVDKLCSGYWEEPRETDDVAYKGRGSFIQQLGMAAFARRSLPETLQPMLARLRQETQTSQCMVLEIDSIDKTVSIITADPPLSKDIEEKSLDGLYYSPVQNVVEDEEQFSAADIDQDHDPRFKHFFPLLTLRSCLGIPLAIPDLVTRHALFLLDKERQKLEPEVLDQAKLAARFIQVALERALLLDYMRRYGQRYHLGQVFGSLVHEAKNKIDGLEGQIKSLSDILQKAGTLQENADLAELLLEAREATNDIAKGKEELKSLMDSYTQMVSGNWEAVDVNAVVRKVMLQLATKAREAGITLELEDQPNLPSAQAIPSRLEQIVFNLVLNAIQQIERQRDSMQQVTSDHGKNATPLLQQGLVIVQTRCIEEKVTYPIQIIVMDTGPGIHYYQQERIFLLDTSTRRGPGLGLFISRNLAETMGGRLHLLDSLMFIGSIFMVELPLFSTDRR